MTGFHGNIPAVDDEDDVMDDAGEPREKEADGTAERDPKEKPAVVVMATDDTIVAAADLVEKTGGFSG